MSETPARDEMLDFALAAFREVPNPVVSAHANKLADAFEAEVRAAAPSAPADRAAALRAETAEDLRSDLYDDLDSYQRQFRISGLQHAQIRDHLATYLTEGLLRRAANEAQVVADNPCPGFPDRCPNPVLVNPDPPAHFGGIRCGCGKQLPAVGAQQPKEA